MKRRWGLSSAIPRNLATSQPRNLPQHSPNHAIVAISKRTMAGISIRKFIRWLPDTAGEPTSTLVLTSPGRRFVDIRILLPLDKRQGKPLPPPWRSNREPRTPSSNDGLEILPLDRLDWAMAGTSSSSTLPDGHIHTCWRHWINSRAVDAEAASDEADMYPQPDGLLTLEKGRMVDPATGRETDYEELWFDPPASAAGEAEGPLCLVLQMEDEGRGKRGLLVRLGEWCQVVVRDGEEEVVAERWEWEGEGKGEGKGEGGWRRVARVGSSSLRELPCERVLRGERALKVGEVVEIGDEVWSVVERAVL